MVQRKTQVDAQFWNIRFRIKLPYVFWKPLAETFLLRTWIGSFYSSCSQPVGHDTFDGVKQPFHRGHPSYILHIWCLHYDSFGTNLSYEVENKIILWCVVTTARGTMSTLLGFIFTCQAFIVNNLSKLKNYLQRGDALKLGAPIWRQVCFVVSYKYG